MRRIYVPLAVLSMAIALPCAGLLAQQQALSTAQMLKNDRKGLMKEIPRITGWQDDTHYLLTQGQGAGTTSIVDVATGKEQPYPGADKKDEVFVRNNDVFFKSATGTEKQLTHDTIEEKNPTLSPDGQKVAFTRSNNLYVVTIASGAEKQLTTDGTDLIYNGWASWVYYEEILGRPSKYRAFWWNPDSKQIAYMHFNDTRVPLFPIYGATGQHGYVENTRYPKAGDPNPEVKVGVVNIDNANTVWADFNERDDQYFGTPFWTPDGKSLWLQWMNRGQDHLVVYGIDPATGSKKPVYDEQQKTWIDWLDDIHFLPGNKGYVVQSDKSGWMHIYRYDMSGKLINQVTTGEWTVKDVLLIDDQKNIAYFTARKENSARFDLYSVQLDGKNLKRLTFGEYNNAISLSPKGSYFVTTYSNVSTPTKLTLVDNKGKIVREIADSKGDELGNYQVAKTELIRVKTPDGFDLPLTITMPLNYDPAKKYPVLISIYGGPNAGTVYDSWNWRGFGSTQWWAKEGLIQVAMDHRGSGHFGKAGQNYLHRDLGDWEIKDYEEIVKWLIANRSVDKNKVCITGFSYGGYTTCMALTKGADFFTHGIAGGSVTDWMLYDSHYTERYMDLPSENPEGYKKSAIAPYVSNYKGNLYIVHGNMDDNVHMQNSIQLIGALEDQKKVFQFMIYPGGRHGWANDRNKWAHFNNEKTRFYYEKLLEKPVVKDALE
ncbi:S9 family peptidase [Deminuibacter soli]|nr:DPP IV N-terminal domain-containing protein [Deminuibacter soli]